MANTTSAMKTAVTIRPLICCVVKHLNAFLIQASEKQKYGRVFLIILKMLGSVEMADKVPKQESIQKEMTIDALAVTRVKKIATPEIVHPTCCLPMWSFFYKKRKPGPLTSSEPALVSQVSVALPEVVVASASAALPEPLVPLQAPVVVEEVVVKGASPAPFLEPLPRSPRLESVPEEAKAPLGAKAPEEAKAPLGANAPEVSPPPPSPSPPIQEKKKRKQRK